VGRIVISDSRCGAFFSANNLLLTLASVCRSAVSPRARASYGERPRDSSSLVVRARLDGSQVTFTATCQRAAAVGFCLQGSKRAACSRTGSHFTLHNKYSADEPMLGQANRIAKPGTTQRDKARTSGAKSPLAAIRRFICRHEWPRGHNATPVSLVPFVVRASRVLNGISHEKSLALE
jgi:hypothetical protein